MEEYFKEKLKALLSKNDYILDWSAYIDFALYDKEVGYYMLDKNRVGQNGDFYTSSSLKNGIFAHLIEGAYKAILKAKQLDVDDYKICEIGAEPNKALFANSKVIRPYDDVDIQGKTIVISNELLDAQAFSRYIYVNNTWQKRLLKFEKDLTYKEVFGDINDWEFHLIEKYFCDKTLVEEGKSIEISKTAMDLFGKICKCKWTGLLIFFDYFRTSQEILDIATGTARAYSKHKDDLELIGFDKDITYSPCSDMFVDVVCENSFIDVELLSQEGFFMKYAQDEIRDILENKSVLNVDKRELMHLISPNIMGNLFRVIYAHKV